MLQKPLRIAWVTNNYSPYISGVAQSLTASRAALQKLGHDVRIITLDFLGKRHTDPDYVIRVPSFLRFSRKGNPMAVPWRPTKYSMHFLQSFDPDIIHSHHPFLLGISALKAARSLNKPIIFTHHTLYHAYAHYLPLPQLLVQRAITQRVAKYCSNVDRVVVPSKPIADMVRNYGLKHDPIVVPSGIRPQFLKNTNHYERKEVWTLLVVSRFVPEKNLKFILDAYTYLNNKQVFTLIFAGYGPYSTTLQSYAYQVCNLTSGNVVFIEKPNESTLATLYNAADLFLFSSNTDTQGLVLAEAMAHGIPVIACNGPGQSAIVHNGQNGFLVNNPEHMARSIEHCYANDQVYQHLRHHAFLTGRLYDPCLLVHKLLNIYRCVLIS